MGFLHKITFALKTGVLDKNYFGTDFIDVIFSLFDTGFLTFSRSSILNCPGRNKFCNRDNPKKGTFSGPKSIIEYGHFQARFPWAPVRDSLSKKRAALQGSLCGRDGS